MNGLGCLSQESTSGPKSQETTTSTHLIAPDTNAVAGGTTLPSPSFFLISIVAIKFAMHNHRLASANILPGQTLRPNPHTASTCSCARVLEGCKNRSGLNISGSGYISSFLIIALQFGGLFNPGINYPPQETTNQMLEKTLEPLGIK